MWLCILILRKFTPPLKYLPFFPYSHLYLWTKFSETSAQDVCSCYFGNKTQCTPVIYTLVLKKQSHAGNTSGNENTNNLHFRKQQQHNKKPCVRTWKSKPYSRSKNSLVLQNDLNVCPSPNALVICPISKQLFVDHHYILIAACTTIRVYVSQTKSECAQVMYSTYTSLAGFTNTKHWIEAHLLCQLKPRTKQLVHNILPIICMYKMCNQTTRGMS